MAIKRSSKVDSSFASSSMTDMIFLLLIFMVLAVTLIKPTAPVKIILPNGTQQSEVNNVTVVSIALAEDGGYLYYVNSEQVSSSAAIEPALQGLLQGVADPTVSLHADKRVEWDEVVKVMNIAKDNKYKLIAATQREGL